MNIFATILGKVGTKAMAISGIFLLGMMMLTVIHVVLRPMGTVIAGTYEMLELLIVIVAAGAMGYTEMEKSHVTVKIITSRFPPRLQGAFEAFIYLIGVGLWIVIVWASVSIMCKRWLDEDTEVLSIYVLPFRFIWIFGLVFLCSVLLLNLFRGLIQAVKR